MKRTLPLRSLAASAVGALAVTGLVLTPPPAAHAAGPGVLLLSQADRLASVRYDGTDSAVQLTAQRLDPTATIGFQFNRNPRAGNGAAGWTAVPGTPTATGDYVTLLWEPPAGLVGRVVALRAVATAAAGRTFSLRPNVVIAGPDDLEHSVSIGPGYFPFVPPPPESDFTDTGYFVQPYADSGRTGTTMVVSGTTTARSGSVGLTWWRPSDRTFRGQVAAAVQPATLKAPDPGPTGYTSSPGGTFARALDIKPFTPSPGDVLAVSAKRSTDDVLPTTLYQQTVSTVQATSDYSDVRPGERAGVSVLVLDPTSQPIAGAEVRRLSDGGLVGYTDASGRAEARQLGGTTETYYVNTADSNAFTAGEDVQSNSVTVGTYTPTPTYLQAITQDGERFDRHEYVPGDLLVQVYDQQSRPFGAGTGVRFRTYRSSATPPSYRNTTADSQGRVIVPFSRALAAGAYTLDAQFASTPTPDPPDTTVTFTMGDARLQLTPTQNPVQRAIGGQVDYTGRLMMGGQPLTGRPVSLRFVRGVEVVPGDRADAAIVQGRRRVLARNVTTDGDGRFVVTVDDPAGRPRASEIGGRLVAATADQPRSASFVDGNAAARDISSIRFGDGRRGRVRVVLGGASNGPRNDVLRVTAPTSAAGETVRIYRTAPGGRALVATRRLGRAGDLPRVVVDDRNGRGLTTYVVELVQSRRVVGTSSRSHRVG